MLLASALAVLLLGERSSGTTYPVTAAQLARARADLAGLVVVDTPRAPGYDRDAFGPAWADVDRNGCDTRNDVLARDLTAVTFKPGTRDCVVVGGRLVDRYTGAEIQFRRGQDTSSLVQVDHVVALADAWRSGAHAWSPGDLERFANDPQNLLAVDGAANQDKGASAADEWLPPQRGYRCRYVAAQVAVKARWSLTVTSAERREIERTLGSCVTVETQSTGRASPGWAPSSPRSPCGRTARTCRPS